VPSRGIANLNSPVICISYIPSAFPERKPYATYVHQLVKATSFMLTKETANGHVGLTLTICRNFEFYQNDTKIRRKLAYENV